MFDFENKIRTFLYHKGMISEPVYESNWKPEEFRKSNKKYNFGVHLEVSSDNPYHCFEVYSEASTKEPKQEKWKSIQKNWQNAFNNGKKEMKSLFGKKVPNLTVELYIVDYSKHEVNFGYIDENYDED